MGLFDGLEDPLSEVSDALSDFGADDQAGDLDDATRWIQARIDQMGSVPTPRARFLIGAWPAGTVPVDQVDWSDAIVQAGRVGESLMRRATGLAGYGELATAALEQQLAGIEEPHEQPLHWVEALEVDEGLSRVWTATVTLAKPDAAALLAARGNPNPPMDLLAILGNAFDDDDGDGLPEGADIDVLAETVTDAVTTPGALADQVWDRQHPDELDLSRATLDHTVPTGTSFVGKTVPSDYLGAFARVSLARRFDDDQFTLNERWFSGRVCAFEDLGFDPAAGVRRTRVTIRPHLHQLSLRRRYRAFKDLNAVQIVLAILKEHQIYQQGSSKDATGTAIRLAPGGRELFGPLGVPDALTAAVGKLSGIDPFGIGEKVSDAVNDVLEQPIEDWRPKREYCVQYGETDLDFVERLLEEEGLTYFFEHRERLETLVICEDPRLAGKKVLTAGRLPITATTGPASILGQAQNNESAWDMGVARKPVPSGVTLRDRSYARPYDPTDLKAGESLDLLSPGNLSSLSTPGGLEQLANQALGLATELSGAAGTEDYAGPEAQIFEWPARLAFPRTSEEDRLGYDAYDGPPMALLRLEELRAEGAITRGQSDCATLAPGSSARIQHRAFDVLHPAVQKPQRFLITRVRHTAGPRPPQPGAQAPLRYEMLYSNRFEGQNIALPYRPPRRRAKPRIHGVHTAFVIDTARGEDPATSPAEVSVPAQQSAWRVRVRMPWERSDVVRGSEEGDAVLPPSAADEGTTWLRFGQPFTGAGFGMLFVPRVGMEVVIGYEEGDPDRPYVLGALYAGAYDGAGARHASRERPKDVAAGRIDYPSRMNEAGITSCAWPRAGRAASARESHMRFDDSAGDASRGHGRVSISSKHDYAKQIGQRSEDGELGDHVTTVLRDQNNTVGGDQIEKVHGDQTLLARHESSGASDWGREVDIAGDERIRVGGGEEGSEDTDEDEEREEESGRDSMRDKVVKDDTLKVGRSRELHVAGGETIRIEGEGAGPDTPGRLLDVAKGSSKVEIDDDDRFIVTGDRRVKAVGPHTVRAKSLDIKSVTPAPGGGPGEGEENGGLTVDPSGASLTSKGAVTVEAPTFSAQSRADRVLVKAATRIVVRDREGNRITLDARARSIVIRAATASSLTLGLDAARLEMREDALELSGGPSSWRIGLEEIGSVSRLEGPEVTFAATDEIALHAPSIELGETD